MANHRALQRIRNCAGPPGVRRPQIYRRQRNKSEMVNEWPVGAAKPAAPAEMVREFGFREVDRY